MVSGYYDLPVECVSSPNPNEVIIVVFSSGRNRRIALDNARIRALNVVLFGPDKVSSNCSIKPLFNDIQKARNYEYFKQLMNDEDFITNSTALSDERIANKVFRDIMKSRKQIRESFVITVNLNIIEHKLQTDEIK
jgi:hypothetical protein